VPILFQVLPQRLHVLGRMWKPIRHQLLGRTLLVPPDAWLMNECSAGGGAWRVVAVCASSSQQGCLYACRPTVVLDQDKTIPEQCQCFSLRVAKGWLTNDSREARREANRHRLESGSDFEQDVSSEDHAADPESPHEGAGAGDSWGVAGVGPMGLTGVTAMIAWSGVGLVGRQRLRETDNSLPCPAGTSTRDAAGLPQEEWDTRLMWRVRFISASRRPPRAQGEAGGAPRRPPPRRRRACPGGLPWKLMPSGLASIHTRGPACSSVGGARRTSFRQPQPIAIPVRQ
jgi:hypothetical protein